MMLLYKKRFLVSLAVVSALVVFLIEIPAHLFVRENHYVTPLHRAVIEEVRGTLWEGQALLREVSRRQRVLVNWSLSLPCLLMLTACMDINVQNLETGRRQSTLSGEVSLPIIPSLIGHGCGPVASVEVDRLSLYLTPALANLLVPQLIEAKQSLEVSDFSLDMDLAAGVLKSLRGNVKIDEGVITYALGSRSKTVSLPELSGRVETADGFRFKLMDPQEQSYMSFETNASGELFSFKVFDALAVALGFVSPTGAQNSTRFEMSQSFRDFLCEQQVAMLKI